MYDMRKNSQRRGTGLTLTVPADARAKRARRVAMEAMENFMIFLVVEICRLERISRDFWVLDQLEFIQFLWDKNITELFVILLIWNARCHRLAVPSWVLDVVYHSMWSHSSMGSYETVLCEPLIIWSYLQFHIPICTCNWQETVAYTPNSQTDTTKITVEQPDKSHHILPLGAIGRLRRMTRRHSLSPNYIGICEHEVNTGQPSNLYLGAFQVVPSSGVDEKAQGYPRPHKRP